MPQALATAAEVPVPVALAVVGVALLVVEHVYALVTPPYGLHVPFFFHLSFGASYAWLGVVVWNGGGWALVVLTVLLARRSGACSSGGRRSAATGTWSRRSSPPGSW